MITMNYINGNTTHASSTFFTDFEKYIKESEEASNQFINDFSAKLMTAKLDMEICNESVEYELLEEDARGIITKIGDQIIEICKKFCELVDQVITKIKSISFSRKTDIQKLDKLIVKHPELKDQAIAAWKNGDLELSDARSLNELDKAFDEILKLSKEKNVDPSTLRSRWNKKLSEIDKSAVIKTAGAAATLITLALAIKTFNSRVLEARSKADTSKSNMMKRKAECYQHLKSCSGTPTVTHPITNDTGKYATLLSIYREYSSKHAQALRRDESIIEKMSDKIADSADKLLSTKAMNFIAGDKKSATHTNFINEVNKIAAEKAKKNKGNK